MPTPVVVGVDACRQGWFAVVLREGTAEGMLLERLDGLVPRVPDAAAIAVDMPLTLPRRGPRAADLAAKELLGPRHVTVFLTPPREVLDQTDYSAANARSKELTDRGLSTQAYALRDKCLATIDWALTSPIPVHEVHPEVSFAVLLGAPAAPKRTWLGVRQRTEALAAEGIVIAPDDPDAAEVAVDDVLDAAVAAWSCRRVVAGEAVSLPSASERARLSDERSTIVA